MLINGKDSLQLLSDHTLLRKIIEEKQDTNIRVGTQDVIDDATNKLKTE